MLIISKFHDYYDTVLGRTGVDKTCVYERATESIACPKELRLHNWTWPRWKWKKHPEEFLFQCIIGFAGEVIPMIYWTNKWYGISSDYNLDEELVFLYDLESCQEFLDEKYPENRKKYNARKYMDMGLGLSDQSLEEFYNPATHKKFKPIFMEQKTPLFLAHETWRDGTKIDLNPELKPIKFMKVKDPFTTFQEIHMFLSGVIGMANRDTAEVGNDDRIKQRGFDKWSFRREPTKRKRKS